MHHKQSDCEQSNPPTHLRKFNIAALSLVFPWWAAFANSKCNHYNNVSSHCLNALRTAMQLLTNWEYVHSLVSVNIYITNELPVAYSAGPFAIKQVSPSQKHNARATRIQTFTSNLNSSLTSDKCVLLQRIRISRAKSLQQRSNVLDKICEDWSRPQYSQPWLTALPQTRSNATHAT